MRIPRVRDLEVERERNFSSQRLFQGLDLFLAQRRQELSFRAVVSDAMFRDHDRQCLVQVLMDDRLRSGQGMAPVSAFELHDYVVKAHRVISIHGALVALGEDHLSHIFTHGNGEAIRPMGQGIVIPVGRHLLVDVVDDAALLLERPA